MQKKLCLKHQKMPQLRLQSAFPSIILQVQKTLNCAKNMNSFKKTADMPFLWSAPLELKNRHCQKKVFHRIKQSCSSLGNGSDASTDQQKLWRLKLHHICQKTPFFFTLKDSIFCLPTDEITDYFCWPTLGTLILGYAYSWKCHPIPKLKRQMATFKIRCNF